MEGERFVVLGRFLMVGVVNGLAGLSVIYACKALLGVSDIPANMSGYAVGLLVSFILNRRWTFQHTGNVQVAILRFLTVFAVAYSVNLQSVLLAIGAFHIDSYIAHLIGMPFYTATFYLGSRLYAFRG
jgi:putative flippase GtrA